MTFTFLAFFCISGCVFTGSRYFQGTVGGVSGLLSSLSRSLCLALCLASFLSFSVGLHCSRTYESVATWPTLMTQVPLLYDSFYVGAVCGVADWPLTLSTVKKSSLLKHGRIDIVQCLRDLPKTKHISHSFNVDVFKATVSYERVLAF